MTTISHKNLAGTQLHENKGVAAATNNTVATASSGATVWQKLTASHLTTTGNPFGGQLFHVEDQKASGTAGGNGTTAAWTTRILNTSLTNEITSASLASNQITLPAGTYFVNAWSIFDSTTFTKLRLRNITDSTTARIGASLLSGNGGTTSGQALLNGRFTLAGTKVLELQYYISSVASGINSLGPPVTSGEVEIYSSAMIWKVA